MGKIIHYKPLKEIIKDTLNLQAGVYHILYIIDICYYFTENTSPQLKQCNFSTQTIEGWGLCKNFMEHKYR